MPNTIEYLLSLKDDFSAQFKQAAQTADSSAGKIVATGQLIASGVAAIGPVVSGSFELLKGDYSQLGSMLSSIPGPIGQVGGAIGNALGSALEETTKYTESMRKASAATGASVGFISQFTEAADDQFVSQEAVTKSLEKFSKGLGGAMDMEGGFAANGKGTAQVLEEMGINATDATGKVLPLESLIPQIADKFQAMGAGSKASALSVQLFGKSGQELLPVLLQGRQAMEDSMKAAADMGLAIDDKAVTAVTHLKQQQDALGDSYTAVARQLSVAVIPELAKYTEGLNTVIGFVQKTASSSAALRIGVDSVVKAFMPLDAVLDAINPKVKETAEVEAKAATEAQGGAKSFDELQKMAHTSSDAFLQFSDMSRDSTKAIAENSLATQAAAQAQSDLKARTDEVISAIGGETKVMTEAQETQTIMELATGKISAAQFETETAVKAVMQALKDGKISQLDAVKTMKGLSDGTITARDAMDKAGHSSDALKGQMTYVEQVVAATGREFGNLAGKVDSVPSSKTVALDAVQGPNWNAIFGPGGLASGLHDGTVSKTLIGITDPSFGVAEGNANAFKDSSVSKRLYGQMDGSFTAAKDYWYSIDNGVATAHIFTSVQIDYNPPTVCFAAGTPVCTPGGTQTIEALRVGDAVIAFDHAKGENVVSTVTRTFSTSAQPTIRVHTSDGKEIHTTPGHVFWCNGAYIQAHEMKRGDVLQTCKGRAVAVIQLIEAGPENVYNIEVDTHHNYYAHQVLVHNASLLAATPAPGGMQTGTGQGGALSFNNNISAGVDAQRVARMVNQAQARAARQALLRAGVGR